MMLSINQPCYLPWLGYFDRIARSDLHVVLDHVQLERSHESFTRRNKIMTPEGIRWLKVPVIGKEMPPYDTIPQVLIDNTTPWQDEHWRLIQHAYQAAPEWHRLSPQIEPFYQRPVTHLIDLLHPYTEWFMQTLGISTPLEFSRHYAFQKPKSDLILEICLHFGAKTYLSGPFGRDYLDEGAFRDHGIDIRYHEFQHPAYDKVGKTFESHLACLDLMMHHRNALEILTHGS